MKRLEKLKIERNLSECLSLLPAQTKVMLDRYYMREIELIEQYGKPDTEVDQESFKRLKTLMEVFGVGD